MSASAPPIDFAALGAFLSGVAAVLGAGLALRRERRRGEEECEERIAAFREGLTWKSEHE